MTVPTENDARRWAQVALVNIGREYPHDLRHLLTGPHDRPPTPRAAHPAFYGAYDWHSSVEMHWVLVRLLAVVPDALAGLPVREALEEHLSAANLEAEAAYLRSNPGWERPYGWGWALTLAEQLAGWDDPDGQRWAAAMRPLAGQVTAGLTSWLSAATYPVRHGMHPNSAFALSRALPHARRSAPELAAAIRARAMEWFAADRDYPGRYEPSGADFLSPALVEAELMAQLLPVGEFVGWLDRFLPDLAEQLPSQLFEPVPVSDPTDGQIAHLHGLNLSRAWCWRRLADTLPPEDPRHPVLREAAERHATASLEQASGSDYAVEHWLAAYAVLLLT